MSRDAVWRAMKRVAREVTVPLAVKYYYVASPRVTVEAAQRSRQAPDDTLFAELQGLYLMDVVAELGSAKTLSIAERILHGELLFPGDPPLRLGLPFDPRDIDKGSPRIQLFQASLVVPSLLLKGYRLSGREDFFLMARDVLLGWASYERRGLLPKGRLWNDHAIAERVFVLADFWSLYRHHPRYEPRAAQAILTLAARAARFLADPSRFTAATNHGVMQNLALWHFSLAFPALPGASEASPLALRRLSEQMDFYVSDEGVVLEHSAGYHALGLQFISMAFRYMALNGMTTPPNWRDKYERAREVYAALRRPDGSLPVFGDTRVTADPQGPPVTRLNADGLGRPLAHESGWRPRGESSLYSVAGYAVWWDGLDAWPSAEALSQTVVCWSHFPGHGHEHADEMSVLLWAGGHTWWTNLGYWPYGLPGRAEAESWTGSNAPHLTDETTSSPRVTRLLAHGWTAPLAGIDLERTATRGAILRRQVVRIGRTLWLVIDHASGDPGTRTRTVWTTWHDVRLRPWPSEGIYELSRDSTAVTLTTFLLGSPEPTVRVYRGSRAPFLGWQAVGETGAPASSILVEQPTTDAWTVAVWSLNDERPPSWRVTARPSMLTWEGPEKWTLLLPLESRSIRVSREGDEMLVLDQDGATLSRLGLESAPATEHQVLAIREARERALEKYPQRGEVIDHRLQAAWLPVVVRFLQDAGFAVATALTRGRSRST